jgi:hypothetical protein
MADRRLHSIGVDVLIERTDAERRLHALGAGILIEMVRTWGDIPIAKKVWHQSVSTPAAKTAYFRKPFAIGPGYISGGVLTLQADKVCYIRLNGDALAPYTAGATAVTPVTYTIPRQKLRGGDNILAFKLVSEAGLRGMLEFKLEVS